jgi:L-ascorbate metabolism protein UlaG (beta-lactamase superfamily)
MQINGRRILVDPVLSGHASPIPGMIKSFRGTDLYSVSDLPQIDYLFITHDHYDHLDYKTITQLKPKIGLAICGLGIGSHLEFWGYDAAKIIERDWFEKVELEDGFQVHITPARHFSGRSFSRNNTLWVSFVLQTPSLKIFMGGDGGYDTHFAEIGKKYGPFDLAIVENGQYNMAWRYIHTLPEQVLQAAMDLNARRLFPVHSSKFALGRHPWDESLLRITELNKSIQIPLVTPLIGEQVNLDDEQQKFKQWWRDIR